MNDIELIDEIVRRAEEHQKQKEKDFAISELEKIKEILNNKIKEPQYQHEGEDWVTGLIIAEGIVDYFISELKGE